MFEVMDSLDYIIFDILHLSGRDESALLEPVIGLMRFITHLGDGIFLIAISVCVLALLLFKKMYKTSIYWTTSIAFSFIFCASLKNLIGRNRPDNVYHLIEVSSPAMPSGHALKSTVVYIGIYILILRLLSLSAIQKKWMKLFFLLPFFIGMSRIFLGVHWPSDVIMGWLFGAVISGIFYIYTQSDDLPRLAKGLPTHESLNPLG